MENSKNKRILEHPILDALKPGKPVTIYYNGQAIPAQEGDTIAAALVVAGIRVFRHTHWLGEPRGIFCAIGQCTDCAMEVDGVGNTKVCITKVRDGMKVVGNF